MKKLGLRVLAGGLAAMMTVSVLTPAKMARAENDLLIAPAPIAALNTLYITADMVDSDNEIIISGENWERIVVTKEAAAANIYFDEVDVGELVVESGSDSVIQLWDVDVSKVTVKEPELEKIDMTELRTLLAEKETSQQAIDYFMKVQAENEKILRSYPCIVTKETAVVDTISAGAGIRLDLHEGDVKALTVAANDKLDRIDVTLEGYNGDVTYVGNDKGFSVVNLKNVESRINKLTVADSTASNYLNVSSKDSVALNVEVAGDAKVSLNIPMGELTIAEAAKAAKVDVLNAVDNMTVGGDNAQVEIASIGNIAQASITGDKVTVSGTGVLTEVVILGKDAYVSTKGTDVEGENTYVEPVYVEPKVVVKNVYDNMTAGPTELTKNSDGSAAISFNGQYQTATFNVPATVDVNRIRSITVEVTIKAQFGISVITKGGEAVVSEYPGYGISEETKKEFTYYINPAEQKIGKIGFMSLNAGQPDMVVNSVTFTLYDEGKAPTPKPTQPPAAPSNLNLPEGSKEWQFADMLPAGGWGNTVSEAANNGIKAEYERQYACTTFTLPEVLTVGDFEKVIVTASSVTGPLGIELLDADGKVVAFWWNQKVTATTDLDLTYKTVGYGGGESVSAENLAKQVAKVNVMYHGDGEGAEAVLYRIAFVAKPGAGSGNTPTPTPKPDEGDTQETGTQCITDKWAVHVFTEYDLRDYAGTTIEISVDMRKTGGSSAAQAHAQLNNSTYTGIAWGESIKDEWTNFSYTWDVPAAFADEANPVNFGFRTVSDVDYSEYTFYYKDFTFTGTPVGGESASVKIAAPEKTTLVIGETLQLKAETTPADKTVTWSSADAAIATVDDTGLVTAVSGGAVKITAVCGEATDEVELTVEKAFYLVHDDPFSEIIEPEDIPDQWITAGTKAVKAVILHSGDFATYLPEELKSVLGEKLQTMEGICETVDSIEFTITLTKATAKEDGEPAYEPQAEFVVQGSGPETTWMDGTFCNKWVGVGQPNGTPITKSIKFYVASQTWGETGEVKAWSGKDLAQVVINVVAAEPGSAVEGSATIKINLK